jgi:hypothetical protein
MKILKVKLMPRISLIVGACMVFATAGSDTQAQSHKSRDTVRWRTFQEEEIQHAVFRYLFKTWAKKWPKAKAWNLGVLGVNSERNPVFLRLFKRLKQEGYPVTREGQPGGLETLSFHLHDLKWLSRTRVQVHAQVSKAIETEGSPDIYYGDIRVRLMSGRWSVTGVKGDWEQPE